jgi:hypothetical protein
LAAFCCQPVAGEPPAGPKAKAEDLPSANVTPFQVIQRTDAASASYSLSGKVGHADAAQVQVRVVGQADGKALAGFDWARVDAKVAGGTWSGKLEALPVGGEYTLQFRALDAGGAVVETGRAIEHVLVGDLWICAGQSNMEGRARTTPTDAEPPIDQVHAISPYTANKSWELAKEPQTPTVFMAGHSPALTFAKTIHSASKVPIGIVRGRKGAPVDDWEKGKRGSAYEALAEIAGKAGGKVKGIVWYQGESDALVDLGSAKSAAMAEAYMQKTLRAFQNLRADFGTPSTPVIVVQLASMGTKNPLPLMYVRERQRQLAEAGKDIFVVAAIDLPLSSDGLHLSLQGYKMAGKRFGDCALSVAYGEKRDWSGPRFKRAWFRDERRLEFVAEFDGVKERLQLSDRAAGVFAMENGVDRKTPKSVSVLNDSALLVTMEAPLAADATAGYAYGGNGKPLGLTDRSGLPALPFYFRPIGTRETKP